MFSADKRSKESLESIYTDPEFQRSQEQFEYNLGKYAYNHTRSYHAVNEGLDRLKIVLYEHYKDEVQDLENERDRQKQIFLRAFTRDDPTSAGQVGEAVGDEIFKIIDENMPEQLSENQVSAKLGLDKAGNLREKMTAFYNAAYYNPQGPENHDSRLTFKAIVQNIIDNNKLDLIDKLGLDKRSILEAKKRVSKNPFKEFISDKESGADGNNFLIVRPYHDKDNGDNFLIVRPYHDEDIDEDNEAPQQKRKGLIRRSVSALAHAGAKVVKGSASAAAYAGKAVANATVVPVAHVGAKLAKGSLSSVANIKGHSDVLDCFSLAAASQDSEDSYILNFLRYGKRDHEDYLHKESDYAEKQELDRSEREKAFQKEYIRDNISPVLSGQNTKYVVTEGMSGKIGGGTDLNKRGFPLVAGISGTTARMLQSYMWLGLNDRERLLDFRLALMGWMLPERDHSLYEILKGSHMIGVRGREDMTDVSTMDLSVDPLTTDEILKNCCKSMPVPVVFSKYGHDLKVLADLYMSPLLAHYLNKMRKYKDGKHDNSTPGNEYNYFSKDDWNEFIDNYNAYLLNQIDPSIAIYTGASHRLINRYLDFQKVTQSLLGSKLGSVMGDFLYSKTQKSVMQNTYKEAKLTPEWRKNYIKHLNANVELILRYMQNAPKYKGKVYRGDWVSNIKTKYKLGSTITHNTFTSTSKKADTAGRFLNYINTGKTKRKAIFIINLNGYSGVDISSINEGEQEVLGIPGARFKVTDIRDNPIYENDKPGNIGNESPLYIYLDELPNNYFNQQNPDKVNSSIQSYLFFDMDKIKAMAQNNNVPQNPVNEKNLLTDGKTDTDITHNDSYNSNTSTDLIPNNYNNIKALTGPTLNDSNNIKALTSPTHINSNNSNTPTNFTTTNYGHVNYRDIPEPE